ncbi:MAG: D-alanine--D-alanine ligase [Clostridiales bacterium]|jgi:D-alanine-D-alanine ligase|nr:D-alanine--D-alanine ligase [Clostridiales bacterium]
MNKKNVMVLFGGVSTEHDISKISAASVIANIPEEKYNVIPVYITKEGRWLLYDGSADNIKNIRWDKLGTQAILSADRENGGLLRLVGGKVKSIPVDIAFPVLHGKNGEDGSIQGLLEMSGIPYVGCGVLASAIAIDKAFTKSVVSRLGIKQAAHLVFTDDMETDEALKNIRYKIGYPCFVKPARAGSSVGINRAENKKSLCQALVTAFLHDRKIVVEKEVKGRELECAVLGDKISGFEATSVGEILSGAAFYDYDAKYRSNKSKQVVPAEIPDEVSEKIREYSLQIFEAIDGFGLARVDFFWDEDTGKIIFNEINTMPGFTQISMYAKLWENDGVSIEDILDFLIEEALLRSGDYVPAEKRPLLPVRRQDSGQ